MAPRPTRNSGGLGDIERLDNPAPAPPQAQPGSPANSTVEQMLQLQAQARLVDNSAAGAGADVVEDDLLSADDHAEGAPDDNRAPVANEEIAQDDFQRDLDERARRRVPDYANLDLEEDVRQFFKTCDDPGTLAHKRRVEDGLRGALQDPFAEPRQGPFPQHPEQRKITKTYSSKGKSRRLSSDSDSELSEEVRRQVRRQLKAQRPITPERKNVDNLFDLFKQLSPGSKKEAVGRLATKDQAAADSDSDASYGNPYIKKKSAVTAPSSSASSSKHKLSPLHMSTHKKKKVAPALSRYDSEPSVLRGRPFQPKAKSSASIDLPALVVVNKLRSFLYVPLWHFTQEGVADGRAREAHVLQTTNPTLTQLLETSGNHAPLGQHKKQDRAMTYRKMSAAFNTFIKTMEKVVHEASGEEKEWLGIEKDAWAEMWAMIRDHEFIAKPNGWSFLALYVDFLRHDYYDAPYGNRLDPSCWQKDIMAKIRAQFEFGGILSASSSSAAQSAATGINIIGQASSSSSSRSQRKKERAAQGAQPFQQGPSAQSPHALGACFVCGSRARHNIEECNLTPEGRDAAHAKRGADRSLVRDSDGTTRICHRWNLPHGCYVKSGTCKAGKHECSVCGAAGHGCQECSVGDAKPKPTQG